MSGNQPPNPDSVRFEAIDPWNSEGLVVKQEHHRLKPVSGLSTFSGVGGLDQVR
jgi:hypothetical protein